MKKKLFDPFLIALNWQVNPLIISGVSFFNISTYILGLFKILNIPLKPIRISSEKGGSGFRAFAAILYNIQIMRHFVYAKCTDTT